MLLDTQINMIEHLLELNVQCYLYGWQKVTPTKNREIQKLISLLIYLII